MVCFDIPSSRPTSAALRPASICFNAPIISTSLYFLFAMLPPFRKCENHISSCADFGEQVTSRGPSFRCFPGPHEWFTVVSYWCDGRSSNSKTFVLWTHAYDALT